MNYLNTQIVEHMTMLRALRFQQETYKIKRDEFLKLHRKISKKQIRLNQRNLKNDFLQKLKYFILLNGQIRTMPMVITRR